MSTNHVFSAFSLISFIIVSIPFPWHLEAWNTGTCLYMFWVGLSCLTFFINSVIWDANFIDWAPVWCDITTRIILAVNVAIPATALTIQRRLYYIVAKPVVIVTKQDKRKSILVDSLIGFGLPILNVILSYIVQQNRYDVLQDFGCYPALINTALTVVLVSAWPLAIGFMTGVYCSLNIYHLYVKRRTIKELLSITEGSLNFSRYTRLMLLSGIDILCTLPLGAWALYTQMALAPVIPWPGWAAAHAGISQVIQIPRQIWASDQVSTAGIELTRWSSIICAIIFFMFFGFADEARKHYSIGLRSLAKILGYNSLTGNFSARTPVTKVGFGAQQASPVVLDGASLPPFHKTYQRDSMNGKLDPFGTPYGSKSAFTISTNYFAPSLSSKHEHGEKIILDGTSETEKRSRTSSLSSSGSPVTVSPISALPLSYKPGSEDEQV